MAAIAAKQLTLFTPLRLPHHPYCTQKYDSGYSRKIRVVDQALGYKYVQPNAHVIYWRIVFDIDGIGAVFAYEPANLPPFSWSAKNPANGHAHVSYELEIPVSFLDKTTKAARLLVSIERAIGNRLKADLSFNGSLIQNPIHGHWHTHEHRKRPYSLSELAEWVEVELSAKYAKPINSDNYSFGRNFLMCKGLV